MLGVNMRWTRISFRVKFEFASGQRIHIARACSDFYSIKRLGAFLILPLTQDGMLVHYRVMFWVEKGTVTVKFLAQEHKQGPLPGQSGVSLPDH